MCDSHQKLTEGSTQSAQSLEVGRGYVIAADKATSRWLGVLRRGYAAACDAILPVVRAMPGRTSRG